MLDPPAHGLALRVLPATQQSKVRSQLVPRQECSVLHSMAATTAARPCAAVHGPSGARLRAGCLCVHRRRRGAVRCSLADGDELMLELQYGARCPFTQSQMPSCRVR